MILILLVAQGVVFVHMKTISDEQFESSESNADESEIAKDELKLEDASPEKNIIPSSSTPPVTKKHSITIIKDEGVRTIGDILPMFGGLPEETSSASDIVQTSSPENTIPSSNIPINNMAYGNPLVYSPFPERIPNGLNTNIAQSTPINNYLQSRQPLEQIRSEIPQTTPLQAVTENGIQNQEVPVSDPANQFRANLMNFMRPGGEQRPALGRSRWVAYFGQLFLKALNTLIDGTQTVLKDYAVVPTGN